MTFEEVLPKLRAGYAIRLARWVKGYEISLNQSLPFSALSTHDLLSDEWKVVVPRRTLDDVLPSLREGKEIRRYHWIAGCGMTRSGLAGLASLQHSDVLADDWEIIESPSP